MGRSQIIALLVAGVALLLGSLVLRSRSKGKYEIRTTDLVFIIVPLLFVGLATGKIQGLDLFGVKADLSQLWSNVANTEIENQVSMSPVGDAVDVIETAAKGGVDEIPRLIQEKTEALAFRLGMGGYYGPAIKQYFDALSGSSYLQYVVINDGDGALFGMYDAANLVAFLRTQSDDIGYIAFAEMLNQGNAERLAQLPGFVSTDIAVTPQTSKRAALQTMEELKLDALPVKDTRGNFVGTVERSSLTTSLILAVTRKLTDETPDATE